MWKIDPVCGMKVKEEEAFTGDCGGETVFFCSEGCRSRFPGPAACDVNSKDYDFTIIGGGPAALTAAVYAATLHMNTILLAKDLGGQAVDSTKIENYMGFDFITGPDLVARFERQLLHSHYVDHRICEVEKIETTENGFLVRTEDRSIRTRTVLVATGMTRRRLGIPGEETFQRRGVFYGNVQDLSYVDGADVAVIGGGNSALQMVENLAPVARRIHLVADGAFRADPAVIERVLKIRRCTRYVGYRTLRFDGDDAIGSVTIRPKGREGETRLSVAGVFIAIGLAPNSSLASDLAALNPRGEIIVGKNGATSRPGLFAAGDVTDAFGKRIIIAAGEGAKATLAARQYLFSLRRDRAEQTVTTP